jgi:hypothetical protein
MVMSRVIDQGVGVDGVDGVDGVGVGVDGAWC